MAVYKFSALSNNQVLAFNPAVDTLSIDIVGLDAASGKILQGDSYLLISYQGKTVQLNGVTLADLSTAHFVFANGSQLLVGDNAPGSANDDGGNYLSGTTQGDYLYGLGGNDSLYGGAGADRMVGGAGNDTYDVDNTGDVVVESLSAGIDLVWSSLPAYTLPANVENLGLSGGWANLNGSGNSLDNLFYASIGNNILDGGAGSDTVSYQNTFSGHPIGVTVSLAVTGPQNTGGSGTDTLISIENLTGTDYTDMLTGNVGNNALDGGGGADWLAGGGGNDTYYVDNIDDKVIENASAGTDLVWSSAPAYTLPANVENLRLADGWGNLNGSGNSLNNILYANAGSNVLDGGDGIDTASYQYNSKYGGVTISLAVAGPQSTGNSGTDTLLNIENLTGTTYGDTLTGNAGNNVLNGYGGADTLQGGAGNDTLIVPDLNFKLLEGGAGTDTLSLAGTGLTLDLVGLGSKIKDLEVINLNSGNSLNLTAATVVGLSSTTDKLIVNGTSGSVANIGPGWTQGADASSGGHTYHTYTEGAASLWVETALPVNFSFSVLSLAGLDGSNGFRLDGAAAGDGSGRSVSAAGDVNGDGFADLIVGASEANPNGKLGAGSSYVVFGKASGFASSLDLAALNGSNGFRLDGAAEGDGSGGSVSAAGDVNSDGYADLIVGATGADPGGKVYAGSSYVVFGKASGFAAVLDLATLNGSNGFRLDGAAEGDLSGFPVSAAGDVNGDGYADLIVGASEANPNGKLGAGSSYVVFGKASGFAATLDLSTLNGSNGFRLDGAAAGDELGISVKSAGDVNGDGYADLIVGAREADPNGKDAAGSSYVVFGKASGFAATLDLSTLNGSNGFRLDGTAAKDYSGISVSAAGDVNGDGFADLIVGASEANPNGKLGAGSSYVVFGKASGFAAALDLNTLNGSNGFRLDGAAWVDGSGGSVSAAGDVNGDGFADLIVGAHGAAPNGKFYAGSSYVVFGKASGFAAALDLSTLNGSNGFRLDGAAEGDGSGRSVSAAGDVNGDGFADLIVGAVWASPNGKSDAGSSYVIFGGNFTNSVSKLGTAGNDTLTGTAAAERFVAGQGNDTMIGGGGADVFEGGQGDDIIKVSDLNFQKADGGSGFDTLALTGAGLNLNLADFRNQLSGIERIDLTGSGNNTLTLLKRDMVNLSDTGNKLQVDGNAGDHYHFDDSGWVKGANVTLVGVVYHVFDNGAAHLLLNAALTVA